MHDLDGGLGGFNAQKVEEIQRRQAERLRDVNPKPPPRSRSSLSTDDWQRIGAVLIVALES